MTEAAKSLRSKVLVIARNELGYKESPANSNKTKYGAWYGLNGQPWCMMFVQWVFHQAGILSMPDGSMLALPKRTASCSDLMNAAKGVGGFITSLNQFQPGDVVIYKFGHTGILESVGTNGTLIVIEGNTGVGNDANGGRVMRRSRKVTQCYGVVRPDWEGAAKAIREAEEAKKQENAVTVTTPKSVYLTAQEVLDGAWGNGEERKKRLESSGHNPAEVQSVANALNSGTLRVSVTASVLNVRRGPGTDRDIIGQLLNGTITSVTKVESGEGSEAGWGKTISGWIALDHVSLVI